MVRGAIATPCMQVNKACTLRRFRGVVGNNGRNRWVRIPRGANFLEASKSEVANQANTRFSLRVKTSGPAYSPITRLSPERNRHGRPRFDRSSENGRVSRTFPTLVGGLFVTWTRLGLLKDLLSRKTFHAVFQRDRRPRLTTAAEALPWNSGTPCGTRLTLMVVAITGTLARFPDQRFLRRGFHDAQTMVGQTIGL